jgi:hypothetical protein
MLGMTASFADGEYLAAGLSLRNAIDDDISDNNEK